MSVTPSSTVVGVFTDHSMAERAMEALYNAGFEHEHIHCSTPGSSGGFLEDLKSLFTGTSGGEGNLAGDLSSMGLSDEEARYYSDEYSHGNTVLAVRAAGREQEAQSILHQYGAYNAEAGPSLFKATANDVQQSASYTLPEEHSASAQSGSAQNWDAPPPQTTEERPLEDRQQDIDAPQSAVEYQPAQPVIPEYDSQPADGQTGMNMPESDTEHQFAQLATAAPESDTEHQFAQSATAVPESDTEHQVSAAALEQEVETPVSQTSVEAPGQEAEIPTSQASVGTPEQEVETPVSQASVEAPGQEAETAQPGVVSTEPANDLQQLLAQLHATQQQLQEAKAQLQTAKEQESQLKTARDRQQLEAAKQQLQEAQAELQAILAELRETQARLGQYQ